VGLPEDSYQQPGVAETGDRGHIKRHYHGSHKDIINPTGIVPKEPVSSFDEQHGRERLSG
jgi:glutathionyl-hydroquinone reductase